MSLAEPTSLIEQFKSQKHQKFFETSSGKPIWNVLYPTLRALSQIQDDDTTLDIAERMKSLLAAVEAAEAHQNSQTYADLKQASDQLVVFVMANLGPVLESSVTRQKEITSSVNDLEGQVQDLSSKNQAIQNNWKDLTKKLETDANEIIGKQQKEWESKLSQASKLYDDTREKTEAAVRSTENEIQKFSKESNEGLAFLRDKLEAIEADSLSSSFISRARRERNTGEILRVISFVLLVVVAGFVGYNIVDQQVLGEPWFTLASRFLLVFTLMIPAGYASKEASRHFERSEYYHQRGLGLQALQTDLAGLKEDSAMDYKRHVWDQFFSNIDSGPTTGATHGPEELLRLADKVKSILSKTKDETSSNS
ncbi:MAG: hypothetical protein GY807_16885 [Gammaproteobacteria bacterium]|nr:hypothetical protein [Gammaproteobacteria bacterium]